MKFKIKKNDQVYVIAGKSKGQTGKVVKVLTDKDRVIVENINVVTKHQKPSQQSAGGKVKKEASLHISNVSLIDPKDGKPTRVGFKVLKDGKKVRESKRSGEVING